MRWTCGAIGLSVALAWACAAAGQAAVQPPSGADETVTTVEGITAVATPAKVPLTTQEYEALESANMGFPRLSPLETARMVCVAEDKPFMTAADRQQMFDLRNAHTKTVEFETVKAAYREGRATLEQLVAADRGRQYALRHAGIINGPPSEDDAMDLERWGAMGVEVADWRLARGDRRQNLIAVVTLHNDGRRRAEVPDVTLSALDRSGHGLAAQTYSARPRVRLAPGQTLTTELTFNDVPPYTYEIKAHFGGGGRPFPEPWCRSLEALRDASGITPDAPEAEPAPTRIEVSFGSAQWVGEGAGRVLEVSASAVNRATVAMRMPALSVVLIDGSGQAVGGVSLPSSGEIIAAGEAADFTVRIDEVEPLPGAGGGDPMALMRRVSLVVQ